MTYTGLCCGYTALTMRLRECGARVPDAVHRGLVWVEPLRHLSLKVNGRRKWPHQHSRRIVTRGRHREH